MVVNIRAEFADNLDELLACLQAVRSWEQAREEIKMTITVDAGRTSVSALKRVFESLKPSLPHIMVSSGINKG